MVEFKHRFDDLPPSLNTGLKRVKIALEDFRYRIEGGAFDNRSKSSPHKL